MNDIELQHITQFLWPNGDSLKGPQVHWLLDGARDPAIEPILRAGGLEYSCLYSGKLHPRLRAAAPYLVHLSANSVTTKLLLRAGWGNAWGILTVADPDVSLTQQRIHFKKFLRVQTEQGKVLVFRFYDPRVLSTYLPTCSDREFRTFTGPIGRLVVEINGGTQATTFEADGGSVKIQDWTISKPGQS